MAMATVTETPTFTVGGVASATFGSIGRNFLTFALLALLAAIPQQLMTWYTTRLQPGPQLYGAGLGAFGNYFAMLAVTLFLSVVMTYLLQAAIVYGTVTDLSGKRVSFGSSLGTALKMILPLIGLSIISGVCVGLGFVLLVIPGVILALGWTVAVPVRVVERVGVFESLGRSWELTSGYRGTIFLLALVFALAGGLFSVLGFAFSGVFAFPRPAAAVTFPITYFIYFGLVRAVEALVGGAGVATIYYQLREIKEGVAPDQLAAVFD